MAAVIDQVSELNTALAKAQGEFPVIPRNRTVTVKTKTGGQYQFAYAPLDTILGACKPALARNGLAITQLLEHNDNGRPCIRTELRHANGGVVGSSFPLPTVPDSPQELGSLLTYLRRYTITMVLGIATEEDDDGNHASGNAVVGAPHTTHTTPPVQPDEEPVRTPPTEPRKQPPPTEPLLSPAQRNMLFALFNKSPDLATREARLAFSTFVIGRTVTTSNELTQTEASRLIDVLSARIRAGGGEPTDEPDVPFGELPDDY